MADIWTHGVWTIKIGCENEFVRGWQELARHAIDRFGADTPTLLRDRDRPNVFLTFGSWVSLESVEGFRSSEFLAERVPAMDELVESVEVYTLDEVSLGG